MILPSFGLVSHAVLFSTGKSELFGHLGMIYALGIIGSLGCVV